VDVVERLGGAIRPAGVAEVAVESVYNAMKRGFFVNAAACVPIARALEPSVPAAQMALVAKLAGLPD
jgi:hypothetical protein